jgi:hypothetical protein
LHFLSGRVQREAVFGATYTGVLLKPAFEHK